MQVGSGRPAACAGLLRVWVFCDANCALMCARSREPQGGSGRSPQSRWKGRNFAKVFAPRAAHVSKHMEATVIRLTVIAALMIVLGCSAGAAQVNPTGMTTPD